MEVGKNNVTTSPVVFLCLISAKFNHEPWIWPSWKQFQPSKEHVHTDKQNILSSHQKLNPYSPRWAVEKPSLWEGSEIQPLHFHSCGQRACCAAPWLETQPQGTDGQGAGWPSG